MRYFVLCVCLGVTCTLGKEKSASHLEETKGLGDQHNLKSRTTTLSETHLGYKLPISSKPETLNPLTIRSKIPHDLVIPSVSSPNNVGSNSGIHLNPSVTEQSYSADSLSNPSFENGVQSIDFGYLPSLKNIESGVIRIPAQQVDPGADFSTILNLDTGFNVERASLEVKPIESFESILNSAPEKQNVNSFSIEPATFGFSTNNDVNIGTHNPVSISDFNNLYNLKENTKSQDKSSTKASYSIEQVPEVASIHRTGPLVESDIPTISELQKIFQSKSTQSAKSPETTPTDTQTTDKSDDISYLIQERIGTIIDNKIETNSTNLSYENNSISTTSNTSKLNNTDSLPQESFTTHNVLVTENIVDETKANSTQQNEGVFTCSKKVVNDAENIQNEKTEDKVSNSTINVGLRISEHADIEELAQPDSSITISSSNNTSADNSLEHESNETLITTVPVTQKTEDQVGNSTINVSLRISEHADIEELAQPESSITISSSNNTTVADNSLEHESNATLVTKLNASNFENANDILKETSEFKAIVESSGPQILLEPFGSNDSSQNITLETESSTSKNTSEVSAEPLSINGGGILNNISLALKNANDSPGNVSEDISLISSVEVTKLNNDSLLTTNKTSEVEISVETTDSALLESRIASDITVIDLQAEVDLPKKLPNLVNDTESVQINLDNIELEKSQNSFVPNNNITSSYIDNLVNITLEQPSEEQILNDTTKYENLVNTTSSTATNENITESRISDGTDLEDTVSLGNNSSTAAPILEKTNVPKNDTNDILIPSQSATEDSAKESLNLPKNVTTETESDILIEIRNFTPETVQPETTTSIDNLKE